MSELVLLNIGDSISKGMGVSKDQLDCRYIVLLKRYLESKYDQVTLVDLSENGCTSDMALALVQKYFTSEQFVQNKMKHYMVICHLGNVDAKIVPNEHGAFFGINLYKMLPAKYQGANLDPRPYFSKQLIKGNIQRLESFVRTHVKQLLVWLQGGVNIVSQEVFSKNLTAIIHLIQGNLVNNKIYLIGTVPILHAGFPGSEKSFLCYDDLMHGLSNEFGFKFIDIHNILNKLLKENPEIICSDKFHLNELGHQALYDIVAKYV